MSDQPVEIPYMDRLTSWGELCRTAEGRLHKMGLREPMRQLARSYRMDGGMSVHDAHHKAIEAFKEKLESGESELTPDDKVFVEKARSGLMMDLPKRAGVEKELDWISANLHRNYPNVQDAPSLSSINCIIDLRLDPKVRATWWATCWSKRMSPGDTKSKKNVAVKEDHQEVEADIADEQLRKRLFG